MTAACGSDTPDKSAQQRPGAIMASREEDRLLGNLGNMPVFAGIWSVVVVVVLATAVCM